MYAGKFLAEHLKVSQHVIFIKEWRQCNDLSELLWNYNITLQIVQVSQLK